MGLLNFDDPQSAGLMGIASGLLGASGPSRMPVSMGQAIGAGMQQGQQAYLTAQNERRNNLAFQLQKMQLEQQMRQQQLLAPVYERLGMAMGRGGAAPQASMPLPGSPDGVTTADSQGSAQAPSQSQQSSSDIGGIDPTTAAYTLALAGPAELGKAIVSANTPTDFIKTLRAAGIDVNSPLGKQIMQQQIAKQNNIPLQAGRAGAPMYDAQGNVVAMAPKIPDNAIPQVVDGRVVGVSPLPGATGMEQLNAYATAAGRNQAEPMPAFSGTQPVFTNKLDAARGGIPAGGLSQTDQAAIQAFQNRDKKQPFNMTAPAAGGPLTPAPALGAAAGADNAQTELTKKYSDLQQQNAQAQITSSYLQNIKQQAQKAAAASNGHLFGFSPLGPFADKADFINGLLAPFSEKATDAVTARDLLDKYSNQIVSRLGTGGLGTDAARSILQSAYPNAHMTLQAINEAADNLIGANEMVKAKAAILAPHGNARDPVAYQQKEQLFDQNADPRIWQIAGMSAKDAAAYRASLPPAVAAQLAKQMQNLRFIGALK